MDLVALVGTVAITATILVVYLASLLATQMAEVETMPADRLGGRASR